MNQYQIGVVKTAIGFIIFREYHSYQSIDMRGGE